MTDRPPRSLDDSQTGDVGSAGNGPVGCRRRQPPWRAGLLLLIWTTVAGLLIWCWTSETAGLGFATIVSAAALFGGCGLTLLGYLLFGQSAWKHRRRIGLAVSAALLAAIVCLRVDGFTGGMVPLLRFRWEAKSLNARSVPPDTNPSHVDLVTTTLDDYPRFLGPAQRLSVNDVTFGTNWSESPPSLVWRQPIGAGWSSFATTNGYAITQEQRGHLELVTCYRIADGALVWANELEARHETKLGGVGPRATPTISGGRVLALGATGVLQCLNGADGTTIWRHNLVKLSGHHDDRGRIAWGRANSPLVVDDRVIVPLGGSASLASLICFDKQSGRELWRGGQREIGYSSPIATTMIDDVQIVAVLEDHLCGHDLSTGKELWAFAWPGSSTGAANNSNPVPIDNRHVFISKGYGQGSALVRVDRDSQGNWSCEAVWENPTRMKTKMTNVVFFDGHLYGMDDAILQCLDPWTGDSLWKRGRYQYSQVMRVGAHLIVLTETGDVLAVDATPERHHERGRFQAIEGLTWNSPTVHGPYLLVRNAEEAACYRLPNWQRSPTSGNPAPTNLPESR